MPSHRFPFFFLSFLINTAESPFCLSFISSNLDHIIGKGTGSINGIGQVIIEGMTIHSNMNFTENGSYKFSNITFSYGQLNLEYLGTYNFDKCNFVNYDGIFSGNNPYHISITNSTFSGTFNFIHFC